jgi:uncharacterized protein (TIGR02452 family)
MQKSKRIDTAKKTLQSLKEGYYINQQGERVLLKSYQNFAEAHTRLYAPEELDVLLQSTGLQHRYDTVFEVTGETTLEAVRRIYGQTHEDIFCLNFASAKNPGGGFLNGAKAQEESIAMASGLYNCLLKAPEYYAFHRSLPTCLYSDHMIYSPQVPVFKNDEGEGLDQVVPVSMLTSPAVNTGVIKRNEPHNIELIGPVMEKRIRKVLLISYIHHHKILVLGAWGCGVFQNDPEDVARWFYDALTTTFSGVFEKVIFAIKSNEDRFILPFRKHFIQPGGN